MGTRKRKSLAYTIVQNDMTMLDLWVSYYHRYFDKLFVACDDTKKEYIPHLKKLKSKYKLDYEILSSLKSPENAIDIIKIYQVRFLEKYEWVLYSNLDEFVVADPRRYRGLKDFMRRTKKDFVFCESFNVSCEPDEKPIDYSKPYLRQRKYWIKCIHYNKPLLSRIPLDWNPGCHSLKDQSGEDSISIEKTGLFLLHLKHTDPYPKDERDWGPPYESIKNPPPLAPCLCWKDQKKKRIPEKIRTLF